VIQDFTLANPARLVIDLQGTRLTAPVALYDGLNRGGVRNVRYAQFKARRRPRGDRSRRAQGLSGRARHRARCACASAPSAPALRPGRATRFTPPVAVAERSAPPPAPPVTGGPEQAGPRHHAVAGPPLSIEEYLAAHRSEAAQSQAARITVQWDNASIEDVVAGFAAFSGRTIILGKGHQRQRHRRDQEPAVGPRVERRAGIARLGGEDAARRHPQRSESGRPGARRLHRAITTRLVRVQLCEGNFARAVVVSILSKRGQAVRRLDQQLARDHRGEARGSTRWWSS